MKESDMDPDIFSVGTVTMSVTSEPLSIVFCLSLSLVWHVYVLYLYLTNMNFEL